MFNNRFWQNSYLPQATSTPYLYNFCFQSKSVRLQSTSLQAYLTVRPIELRETYFWVDIHSPALLEWVIHHFHDSSFVKSCPAFIVVHLAFLIHIFLQLSSPIYPNIKQKWSNITQDLMFQGDIKTLFNFKKTYCILPFHTVQHNGPLCGTSNNSKSVLRLPMCS